MFLVGIISWWYGSGLKGQLARIKRRLLATARFFSIGQLFSTLFSPYRQISAGRTGGAISVQFRAFLDKLISRVIGSIVRLITIVAGSLLMAFQVVVELVIVLLWVILPLLPIVGLVVFAIGWVPSWM